MWAPAPATPATTVRAPIRRGAVLATAALALTLGWAPVPAGRVSAAAPQTPVLQPPWNPARSPYTQPRVTVGAVVGEVVDAESGRGVAGAIVSIRSEDGRAAQKRRTDDRGRYYFKSLEPGLHVITATRTGYLEGAYGRLRGGGEGLPIEIRAGEIIASARVDLFRPGVVSGVVVDEASEPVIDARVVIWRRATRDGLVRLVAAGTARTDDRGAYRVAGLEPGDYLVGAPATRLTAPVSTFERIASTGSVTAEVSLLFSMGSTIDPSFTPASPEVIPGGRDAVGDRVALGSAVPVATPDDAGRPMTYPATYYPGVEATTFASPVTIEAGREYSGVVLQLRPAPAAHLSGFVVGPDGPVPNLLVRIFPDIETSPDLGLETAMTLTADDGSFAFDAVPGGTYIVEARGALGIASAAGDADLRISGVSFDPASPATRAPLSGRQALWGRASIRLTGRDDDADGLVLVVSPGARVAGQVTLEDARGRRRPPLANMVVRLDPAEPGAPPAPRGFADATGYFEIGGVAPGRYFLRVESIPDGWHLASAHAAGVDLGDQPLEVGEADVTGLSVELSDVMGSVVGTVRGADGLATMDATVVLMPASPPSGGGRDNPTRLRSARASANGFFQIAGVPAGSYRVLAISEASAADWRDPRRLASLRNMGRLITVRVHEMVEADLRLAGGR